jgi:DNA excision repair protein ERCC-2
VIDTLNEISKTHSIDIPAVDLIGKQWMCPVPISKELSNSDFMDYCRDVRQAGKCAFYKNTRKVDLTDEAKAFLDKMNSPMHSEDFCSACADNKLCPYEMALELGRKSKVVVCDYFHMFSEHVRKSFMSKMGKDLKDSVIIIDEAHNLPDRVRSLMSFSLTTFTLNAAIKELLDQEFEEETEMVRMIFRCLEGMVSRYEKEGLIKREEFINEVESLTTLSFDEVIESLLTAGQTIREDKKKSYTLAIARFLEAWTTDEQDMVRIIKRERSRRGNEFISLSYYCLNPAKYTSPVFDESYSSIMMSGTLAPADMYAEVLGVNNSSIIELKSPFPKENRLNLIVPETTTRYSRRSDEEYERIARKLEGIINSVNVSTAVFFPSYAILRRVVEKLELDKKVIIEERGLSKSDKNVLLQSFKREKGAVLLGVVSGNFGEGIDLPGAQLECIIIVGVPLPPPDLYNKALINYYDEAFGKGWDYGYFYPALTKVVQSAGRCIRSEEDKGLIILLDERYAWKNYLKCVPPDWELKITKNPEAVAKDFFKI